MTLMERILLAQKERLLGEDIPSGETCPECGKILRETGRVTIDALEYSCTCNIKPVWYKLGEDVE